MALRAVLVSPEFLFRVERDPAGVAPEDGLSHQRPRAGVAAVVLPVEQHPDDELLDAADRGELEQAGGARAAGAAHAGRPAVAGAGHQLRRAVAAPAQPRRRSLRTCGCFPDFDDNLRQAFRQETELFFESIMREDRSVLDLLSANYTFVNERLAKHYGIPNVYGSRFRRVTLDDDSARGGLLRQGSILTVTSYATRTSPVIRGKWILENILGTPPPPPPPNVPALKDNAVVGKTSRCASGWREHRANPVCASCHTLMDPIGFSLENFDAVGRWRTSKTARRSTPPAGCPTAASSTASPGCEKALLSRPELFVAHVDRKAADLRAGPRRRVLRRAGGPQDRARGAGRGLPLLVAHSGNRQEHTVSNEEIAMIITKKALPRRTFLRGVGATLALPLLDAMVPAMTALAATPAEPGAAPRLRLHADGIATSRAGRRRARRRSTRAFADPQLAGAACSDQLTVHHQPGAEERLPGHARDVERRAS